GSAPRRGSAGAGAPPRAWRASHAARPLGGPRCQHAFGRRSRPGGPWHRVALEVAAGPARPRQLQGDTPELLEDVLAERAGRRQVAHGAAPADQRLQEVLVWPATRAAVDRLVGGHDHGLAALAAAQDPL